MTLQELSKIVKISEATLANQFRREQEKLLKKNIKVTKIGRGASATYELEYLNDNRAENIFEEVKENMIIDVQSITLMNSDFVVFLGIVSTPMGVFRGSYIDFLNYLQLKPTQENIESIKQSLLLLKEDYKYIAYEIDKTNENYFVAYLWKAVEDEMKIGIGMIKECRRLQEQYHKRDWIPLLKVWLGVQLLSEKQPYTLQEISDLTGLSLSSVRDANKILAESNIYKTTKAYKTFQKCIGQNVELNAFFNA